MQRFYLSINRSVVAVPVAAAVAAAVAPVAVPVAVTVTVIPAADDDGAAIRPVVVRI
jgi:hypothetical protein